MADSATPSPADKRLAVAFSGGRDSTALLHAAAKSADGAQVFALHVHHGLSPQADVWLAHCERFAADLGVRFLCRRLSGRPAAGESIEAWARSGRHAALQDMCGEAGTDLLLLAHHRRDQAETFLLQALRGSGVAGLAAMPAAQWRDGICWARPWLDQPRESIEAYVLAHGLVFIDDASNADTRFERNRLRLEVWPKLAASEAALARSARWAQQALDLQREMAEIDLPVLLRGAALDMNALRQLSPARASNALRAWLAEQAGVPAPASLVLRLLAEAEMHGQWPLADGELRLYRGLLRWNAAPEVHCGPSQSVNLASAGIHEQADWGGRWRVERTHGNGLSAAILARLQLRKRSGGEQFQRAPKSALRSLKKAWQETGVPAWERSGPLLFHGQQLVFVPGLGIDARALAASDETRFSLCWEAKA
ncbi:MAG: tRNA lysidine(34) synthetase TilS [Paucibacter sp.]|nr:tRNA lysidine(34) synthetase TilS [Roseateles sp.]